MGDDAEETSRADTTQVGVRLPDVMIEALEIAEKRHMRNRSAQIRYYVREGLRRDGLLIEGTA